MSSEARGIAGPANGARTDLHTARQVLQQATTKLAHLDTLMRNLAALDEHGTHVSSIVMDRAKPFFLLALSEKLTKATNQTHLALPMIPASFQENKDQLEFFKTL